ncbi:MAG: proton-conducting transporter membrane subunit, partial [Pseudomonadota bacterium]
MTHAFFKALLFLGAGSVIHAMSDEQDMRRMGGIWKMVPVTYGLMWIGSLALAGIPPFSGFYSKDIIIEAAYAAATPAGRFAFAVGIAAAFLTAFYSWRLLFMTFHGSPRADEKVMAHVHESPLVMIAPLLALAAGAAFAGLIAYDAFVGEKMASFWGETLKVLPAHDALARAHDVPTWVKLSPPVVAGAGITLACVLYLLAPSLPAALAERYPRLYLFLLNKWYFDELYDRLFVRPALALGRNLWKTGDGTLIDGLGPDGLSRAVLSAARRVAALQTGYLYHYAFAMLIGVVGLITWYVLRQVG